MDQDEAETTCERRTAAVVCQYELVRYFRLDLAEQWFVWQGFTVGQDGASDGHSLHWITAGGRCEVSG